MYASYSIRREHYISPSILAYTGPSSNKDSCKGDWVDLVPDGKRAIRKPHFSGLATNFKICILLPVLPSPSLCGDTLVFHYSRIPYFSGCLRSLPLGWLSCDILREDVPVSGIAMRSRDPIGVLASHTCLPLLDSTRSILS